MYAFLISPHFCQIITRHSCPDVASQTNRLSAVTSQSYLCLPSTDGGVWGTDPDPAALLLTNFSVRSHRRSASA